MAIDGDDGCHGPIPWLKRVRHSGEHSDVTVRVGFEEFKLHKLPLLSDSTYFHKHVGVTLASNHDTELVLDLPNFPGGAEIFDVVVDHWYRSMEHEISTSNVLLVIRASRFLGVESLKDRALKFLDQNVLKCWKSCLAVLTTFDCEDGLPPVGDKVFDRCKEAFLDNLKTHDPLNLPKLVDNLPKLELASCSMFCNITRLSTAAAMLPSSMAKHIYQCILDEGIGLYYKAEDIKNPKPPVVLICIQPPLVLEAQITGLEGRWIGLAQCDADWVTWLKKQPELVPDLARRAMLLSGLCEIMMQGKNVTELCPSFLCSLLAEEIEANETMASQVLLPSDILSLVVEDTEMQVGLNMGQVQSTVFQKWKFATLLSMVNKISSWWQQGICRHGTIIDGIAKVLDKCLLAHLNQNSLSVAQVLSIYRNFPNEARSSHVDLYKVFKDVLRRKGTFKDALRRKAVSSEQRREIGQMLDIEKLPDTLVQSIFQALELDHEPRLLKRILEIHEMDVMSRLNNTTMGHCSADPTDQHLAIVDANTVVLLTHLKVFMTAAAERERANASLEVQVQEQADELAALKVEKLKLARELQVRAAELLTMRIERMTMRAERLKLESKIKVLAERAQNEGECDDFGFDLFSEQEDYNLIRLSPSIKMFYGN